MTRKALFGILILFAIPLQAQDLVYSPGILGNSITNLGSAGESIWLGPYLNVSHDGGSTWEIASVEPFRDFANSVFSLSIHGQSIWAGVGNQYTRTDGQGELETINDVQGLLYSPDGGNTWSYWPPTPPTDNDPVTTGMLDTAEDTQIKYGNITLDTLPITVPAQSPPWDLDYDTATGTLWLAGQLAGIRRSMDLGRTWERVVLPPDTSAYLGPELGYEFSFTVQPVGVAPAQFHGLNFQAFSVRVDDIGTIWAGTAGGLNRSEDGGISWYHYTTNDGLLGNWVISIEVQTRNAQPPAIWATNWPGRGRNQGYGISVTRDEGASFQTALHGEQCSDFAFDGPRIYVACSRGLYQSTDNGNTFFLNNEFIDRVNPSRSMRPGARIYAVEVTENALWVGSQDGLFKSTDRGKSWEIFRTEVPLDPTGLPPVIPADRVPRVSTYAYPNPFSPSSDRLVRLRYDLDQSQTVNIRIFDYSMTLVREILSASGSVGANEAAWDGTDDKGTRLANGPYFYAIQAGNDTFWGKILIAE
ncbi:MAG: hypothetical protein OXE92_02000 [Bacteroidetes bacterium]|nr:hypothetical protein [Bacteroidota bacterium]